jgi:hypothetical protein
VVCGYRCPAQTAKADNDWCYAEHLSIKQSWALKHELAIPASSLRHSLSLTRGTATVLQTGAIVASLVATNLETYPAPGHTPSDSIAGPIHRVSLVQGPFATPRAVHAVNVC